MDWLKVATDRATLDDLIENRKLTLRLLMIAALPLPGAGLSNYPLPLRLYERTPLIRQQSQCSFSRIETAVAVHLNGWQLAL